MPKLRGVFRMDSSGISLRFPAEFVGIFGGFIGDIQKWVLSRILGDSQKNSRNIYREIREN